MPEDNRVEDDDVDAGEGNAGEASTLDPDAARERWESRRPQPEESFEERQRRIGAKRRKGGPQHPDDERAPQADEQAPELPPTHVDEEE